MVMVCNASLEALNTLALAATAANFWRVETLAEAGEALAFARAEGLAVAILGGGSNTVPLPWVPGLVIQPANRGLEVVAEDETAVTLDVAAGEDWHQLVMTTLERGWYGLENLALIPGSVGAAPIQNIGAYGVELSRFLVSVQTLDRETGALATLAAEDCQLAYRDSVFKGRLRDRLIIWSVRLRLSKVPAVNLDYPELARAVGEGDASPGEVAAAVIALRRAKLPDPAQLPNAGSFFKNPVLSASQAAALVARYPEIPRYPQPDGRVKFPAAWLIDRAGWKGVRRQGVGVHQRQALVLVHFGGATALEILSFSNEIKNDIKVKYDIELEMEPVLLGREGQPC